MIKLSVAAKALEDFKERIRQITRRSGGRSMTQIARELRSYIRGWKEYLRLAVSRLADPTD